VANSAFNELNVGNSYTETFAVKSVDGTEQKVTVTIQGTNDTAIITGTATGSVVEAGGLANASLGTPSVAGVLSVTDADTGQSSFATPASLAGTYGTFTFNKASGVWSYTLDNSKAATQALTAGQEVHDTLSVTSLDGTASQTIDVTVTGANDTASISGTATGSVTEAGGVANATAGVASTGGTLSVSDVDSNEASFKTPSSLSGTYGTFTFNASTGVWAYTLDNSKAATQGLVAGQTVHDTLSVTSLDGTASQTIDVTVTGADDAPTIGKPQITVGVSEEGLSGGIIDTTGNPDSTDATGSLGNLVFKDVDSAKLSVSLTAPAETLKSGGQSIIWTSSTDSSGNALLVGHFGSVTGAAVLTVTCDTAGRYTVSLEKAIDHASQGEDVKSLTIGVSVSDGSETASGSLVVNVEDDAPLASNSSQTIYVASDVISVNDLKAGFINDTYLNNTNSVTRNERDNDSYYDSLRWGNPVASEKSGYDLVDNTTYSSSSGSAVAAGTAFKVGDFTHINYGIYAGSSVLSSTDMTMSMDVVINGVSTAVSFVVHITHTETPNSSDALASRDIITLPAQTVSVEIDGQDYQVNLLGFKDSSGNVVNTIYTNEDTSNNTFGIYASVTSTADLPQVTGDILTQSGADGAYLYSVAVNGVTYTYNPANGGSVSTSGGTSKGVFDTTTNSLTITTTLGGKFVVNLDSGEYVYTAPATVVSTTAENIAYIIKDNDGDTTNAALTINVTAPSVTTLTSTTTSVANMGLSGEYYGYNETTSPQAKNYNVQTGDGAKDNIDNISETIAIINAKQGVTTSIIGIGTSNPEKASESATDAVFVATTLNYGGVTSGNLGYNSSNVEVSDANAPKVLTAATGDNLFVFLNKGSSSGDASSLVATSSYGNTTDAIIRMLGEVYFTGGSYTFKVKADDGYSIYIDGKQVLYYDANVDTATKTSDSYVISEGLHNIEIVYWDQGGAANFSMSYSLDGGTTYLGFNSTNLALFQDNKAPTLSELQDLVSVNGSWVVRTGSDFTGTSGNDNVTGSDGRDHIRGGDGNDVLFGGSGSDKLDGGTGNDHLIGSLGNDILIGGDGDDHLYGGLGNDTMTGGTGVDRFVWNANDQGTTGAPAIDHITDFSKTSDIIDIRDLLDTNGDKTLTALKAYLSVSTDSNSNITIEVHQGNTGLSTDITNKIVLDGVHYSDFGSGATATTILNTLVDSQHLLIDKS
jgi:T1SS-143 domain-containing protein